MKFQHINTKEDGFIRAIKDNIQVGIINYIWQDEEVIIVTHTKVPTQHEGQGIGKQLVMQIAQYATEHNLKIVPACPYVEVVLNRMPEYQSLLVS